MELRIKSNPQKSMEITFAPLSKDRSFAILYLRDRV